MRILLVEDSAVTAELMIDALEAIGHEVHHASTMVSAQRFVDRIYDVVILDVYLGGMPTYELAQKLITAGRPFFFATGAEAESIRCLVPAPVLVRPYTMDGLVEMLACVIGRPLNGHGRARDRT